MALTPNSNLSSGNWLYRTIWRWHFYAGLFCIPFVITLALSGTVYLFKPQIDTWLDSPYHSLAISEQRRSANEQIAAALAAVPDSRFLKYTLPESDQHAVVVNLSNAGGERILVYVQPYTLEILKVIDYDNQFIRQVRTFHGELLAGNTGSVLVELAGNWAIVLILSGLYLWWPRQSKSMAGILYPRLQLTGRQFWRDLHGVLGFWVSILALFLLLTGLPWTLVWNKAFQEVRSQLETTATVQTEQPEWTVSRAQEMHLHQQQSVDTVNLPEAVVASAMSLQLANPVYLSPEQGHHPQWLAASDHQNRLLRTRAWINADNASIAEIKPYSDRGTLDLVIGVGIAAHEGQLFGWLNQLISLFVSLSLLVISVSGFIMWRKRKPDGVLGAPQKQQDSGINKGVVMITLGAALFLPLLALSLIAILLLEKLVLQNIQPARLWLGIGKSS